MITIECQELQFHWEIRVTCDFDGCPNTETYRLNGNIPNTDEAFFALENIGWRRNTKIPIKRMSAYSYDDTGKPDLREEEEYINGDACPRCTTRHRLFNDTNKQDARGD